jgi:hypothetical protein
MKRVLDNSDPMPSRWASAQLEPGLPTAVHAVGRQQPLGELTIHAKWRRMQQHIKIRS